MWMHWLEFPHPLDSVTLHPRILTAHSHAPARDARVTAGLVCIVTVLAHAAPELPQARDSATWP